ncbi:hypothetical protein N9537_06030, partial [Porticoccaceae bacterium]|nr:hypothetical protein [Porticoccaceae bacterium]
NNILVRFDDVLCHSVPIRIVWWQRTFRTKIYCLRDIKSAIAVTKNDKSNTKTWSLAKSKDDVD